MGWEHAEGGDVEPTGPGPMNMGPVGGRPGALCIDDENICDY